MTLKSVLVGCSPAIFVLLWSTGFVGAKLGSPSSLPFSFLLVRMIIVAVILGTACLIFNVKWIGARQVFHCSITGFLVHGVYLGGVFWAISNGMPAGVSAIIIGLQPLLTAIIAHYSLNESISTKNWIGFILGLFGLGFVLGPKIEFAGSGITVLTILSCCIAVIGITIGTIYQKKHLQFVGLQVGTFYQYLGAIPPIALGMFLDGGYHIDWTGEFIFALTWLVLVLSIGAITLLMFLIRYGAVSQIASLFYLVPVATAIESYWLFGETLTVVQVTGMLIVVGAVALARNR